MSRSQVGRKPVFTLFLISLSLSLYLSIYVSIYPSCADESAADSVLRRSNIGRDDRAFSIRGCPMHKGRGGSGRSLCPQYTGSQSDRMRGQWAPLSAGGSWAPSASTVRASHWLVRATYGRLALCALPCSRGVHSPWSYYGLIEVDAGRL